MFATFWIGFAWVFRMLQSAILGYYDLIIVTALITNGAYVYQRIKNYWKASQSNVNRHENGALHGKHVIITGGSSGIGKCFAMEVARRGANITIVGRDNERLKLAYDEIIQHCKNRKDQKIECLSLDVSRSAIAVATAFADHETRLGQCYMLVNCAGNAVCGKIEDTAEMTLKHMLDVNLVGSYNCVKAIVPGMKTAKEGKIVLVGSQASLLGIYGYSAYCASKFAVRGLAESLSMELKPYNVSVTLALPPDTDTPGFAVEQESKPLETKLISESASLVQPEVVAQQMYKDAMAEKFFSIVGVESFILTTLCSGMSPYSSLYELLLQAQFMGPLKLISAFYRYHFDNIINRCAKERESQKKVE
ncbi:hypothetical protein TKK_0002044 [Trichogramma kaykai]|uniref:3-dehydrosphinganine reductase n=1 Tax=Trichogramma kaykai TaxID=54128 RepID=A0ABD2X7Y9_9HYME